MNDLQRKNQYRAICSTYGRMVKDNVLPQLAENIDESRRLWATEKLCRLIPSLTICTDFELNILRDILNGKPPKIHARLWDVLCRNGKTCPASFCNYLMHHDERFKRFRDPNVAYGIENLPLHCAYIILKQEEARSGGRGYRKSNWRPLSQPSNSAASNVSCEQQTLWGR